MQATSRRLLWAVIRVKGVKAVIVKGVSDSLPLSEKPDNPSRPSLPRFLQFQTDEAIAVARVLILKSDRSKRVTEMLQGAGILAR